VFSAPYVRQAEQMSLDFLSEWCCRSQLLEFCRQPIPSLRRSNQEGSVADTSTWPWHAEITATWCS